MKLCGECEAEKDQSEFGKRSASADGLASRCRRCQSDYDKARSIFEHLASEAKSTQRVNDAETQLVLLGNE